MKRRALLTPEQIHARLIFIIGLVLTGVFAICVCSLLYALVFVTQPMKQAPNDAAFIDLVSTLTVFLTGSLAGVLAGNGLKSKPKDIQQELIEAVLEDEPKEKKK